MINTTYYNKLNRILHLSSKEKWGIVDEEILKINESFPKSFWGITDAQQTYLNLLNRMNKIRKLPFSNLFLNIIKLQLKKEYDQKIRVLFFVHEYSTFPSVRPVYDVMRKDSRFDCKLIHIPFFHINKNENANKEINEYMKNGYDDIIASDNCNLSKESPDVVIYLKAYDTIPNEFYITEIEKIVDKVIFIPYGMEIGSTKESMRYQFQLPLHESAWWNISYCTEHYKRSKKYSKKKGKNYLLIGHPRMDLTNYDFSISDKYNEIKKKANDRKIFMFNSHFTIEDGDNWGTFKLYGMDVLNYFANNKDVFLVYRPHPLLQKALEREYKKDSKFLKDYEKLLNNNKDNIYYDNNDDYLISMHISDVLISDANSFIPEYLAYNKPIIYTKKPNTSGLKNKDLEKLLYVCNNSDDIIKYIEDLKKGNDYLKQVRNKNIKKVIKFDRKSSVSEKIINLIKEEFDRR